MVDISSVIAEMKRHGMKVQDDKVRFKIQNSKELTSQLLEYFLAADGKKAVWLHEYNQIVDWLTDNDGRGLLLQGKCGVGKTIMGRFVIPALLLQATRKVVSCYDVNELNNDLDKILLKKIISIDDFGTEEVSVKFGERRLAFAELMDAVEKQGKLIILTTNLSKEDIIQKYGERVLDRIVGTTMRITFNNQSFRR